VLGEINMDHDKDFAAAKREFDRSMKLNDQSSLLWHHLAMWHGQMGHLDEAFAAIRRARELEPTRPVFAMNYSLLLYEARRYDEAVEMAKGVVAANPKFEPGAQRAGARTHGHWRSRRSPGTGTRKR
jgi:Tfp pilus assembly protein PilF